jgi:PleD family two-component response regulator
MRVVVYHSSATVRRILANVLGKMSPVEIYIATTEEECVHAVDDHMPALVIVEKIALQAHDYELLEQLRQACRSSSPRLMVIGYQFTKEDTIGAIRQGVDELMLLPFEADDVRVKVRDILNCEVSY